MSPIKASFLCVLPNAWQMKNVTNKPKFQFQAQERKKCFTINSRKLFPKSLGIVVQEKSIWKQSQIYCYILTQFSQFIEENSIGLNHFSNFKRSSNIFISWSDFIESFNKDLETIFYSKCYTISKIHHLTTN